jgi:uncharacterized protein YcfJ
MPGPYKPFEVFQRDNFECLQYADVQVAGGAETANNRAVGATVLGAGLGLALGAATGDGSVATAGAVAGGAAGATIGAGMSDSANYSLQRRYDIAYAQCMYAKGNQVPGFARPRAVPPPPPPGRDGPPPPRRG